MKALFISNKNDISSEINGGVQICSFEFIEVLQYCGFDLIHYNVNVSANLKLRIVRKLGIDAYHLYDVKREEINLRKILINEKIQFVFLNKSELLRFSSIIKKINSNLDKKYYYGLLFINIFLLYTHIYGMFVIMFEFFWLLVLFIKYRNWGNIKNIFYSIFASSVVFIPWIFAILRAKAERSEPWLDLPNLLDILERFSGNYFMLALFVPFFITPIFWKKIRNTEVAFLYVLIFFTVLVPYLISLIIYPAFQARYVIFASAIFYLIIAYSFNNIKSNFAKLNIAIWFFVISFILMGEYYNGPDNVDWRSATAYLDKQATSSDLLIFSAGYTLKNGFNYYSHRDDLNKIPFPKLSERISLPVDEKNILELDDPLNKNYKNIYVIYHEHRDYNDMILKKIEDYGYVYDSDKEFNGMQIFEFVKSDD